MPQHSFHSMPRGNRESRLPGWCIPFAYAVAAVIAGLTLPRVEVMLLPGSTSGLSSSAAIAIYSSIASGMITLTGVVFSLVFVMVQFSATAYSPRLVLWMSRDPLISHAIGVFTATFLYALAALAWVDRQSSGEVPFFTTWLVVALLLASVGVFVGLVQSLGRLQINSVLKFTGDFARKVIDVMYPPIDGAEVLAGGSDYRERPVTQILTYHGPPRVIQSLDIPALLTLAERAGGIIEMISSVGDTLVETTALVRVYAGTRAIGERETLKAVRTGDQRTFEQDPKYSIHLLVDIAIRALSSAINDPTTAVQALDQIEDLMLRLGRRRLEIGEVRDDAGHLKLVIPVPTWEDFLDLAFSQIRLYGATSLQVMRRMKALLNDLVEALPEQRCPAVRRQQKRLDSTIARSFQDVEDSLEASEEDREGLGATRRRSPLGRPEGPAGNPPLVRPDQKITSDI
jgi:uncharacterized membrane protein